ncbi:MAG: DUF169 domain-containing protein [Marinifilaceae bacterium]|jgi:uncharacterized protein (DUF169 family)|nr:DUF169 domain-containing protein [Marinifilaceae bacterium]
MEIEIKKDFLRIWKKYFPDCEMPLAIYYSNDIDNVEVTPAPKENPHGYTCIFAQLNKVRNGQARAFNASNIGCFGGIGTLGFAPVKVDDKMIQFLTKVECFKKSESEVIQMVKNNPPTQASADYLIFKPFNQLKECDKPEIISFFAKPDVISALHALANYDKTEPNSVLSPFGSGCDCLVGFAIKENINRTYRPIMGGFDPAMRKCVKSNILTFSIPYERFKEMIYNIESSFLNTYIWDKLKPRLSN